jgi:hypothetical protein
VTDCEWARGPDASRLTPGFDRPRSWKERPIDVRAEAAAQVGPQRRGEVIARRIADIRDRREAARAEAASRCPALRDTEAIGAGSSGGEGLRTPEIRRRRRSDPYYPSSWFLWMGDKGKAYVRAWESYSWGMSERPEPWAEFSRSERTTRRRLPFGKRGGS